MMIMLCRVRLCCVYYLSLRVKHAHAASMFIAFVRTHHTYYTRTCTHVYNCVQTHMHVANIDVCTRCLYGRALRVHCVCAIVDQLVQVYVIDCNQWTLWHGGVSPAQHTAMSHRYIMHVDTVFTVIMLLYCIMMLGERMINDGGY